MAGEHVHGDGRAVPSGRHVHGHAAGGHDHAPRDFGRAFAVGIGLQVAFVVAEVICGVAAHSLALLADAGHNVSDIFALALAWGAIALGKRRATKGRTYGLKGASILAALANSLTLVFVTGGVAWEAVLRLRSPEESVVARIVIVTSLAGVLVNGFSAWLFARGSEKDVNIRAAFLHLASDAAVAAGVAVTGGLIAWTGLAWLDPVASLIVAAVVIVTTWSVLRRAVDLAMHAVPHGLDEDVVRRHLSSQAGVVAVHDLHIWAMSTTENALTAHLVMDAMPTGAAACAMDAELREKFAVHHVTIQFDPVGSVCALAGEDVI